MPSWEDLADVSHRVRNLVRRGYLTKVDASGKLLKGRVTTGSGVDNDGLDIVHPVGMVARVAPGPKAEAITLDVGGDASRRVILAVLGDRATHPSPKENEALFYSPGDPKKKVSVSKDGGVAIDGDDKPVSATTKDAMSLTADKTLTVNAKQGTNFLNGAIAIDANGNVTMRGTLQIAGSLTVGGALVVGTTITAGGNVRSTNGVMIAKDFIKG